MCILILAKRKRKYSKECWKPNRFGDHWLPLYGQKKRQKNNFLYTIMFHRRKSYRFGTTWV